VIHAYYPELLGDILRRLSAWTIPHRIVVTTSHAKQGKVADVLAACSITADLMVGENRGRDILPFLNVMRDLRHEEKLILKLHTKRSTHRIDGDLWRSQLYEKLLHPLTAEKIMLAFRRYKLLGMAAPADHILCMQTYYGSNAGNIQKLVFRMKGKPVDILSTPFVAGSMFYTRPEAIAPLCDLDLDSADFEDEAGLVDGTLAHAVERCFAIAARKAGYYIADVERPETKIREGKTDYLFAEAESR
jgi:lipopolysaccharide biosynthesis protein